MQPSLGQADTTSHRDLGVDRLGRGWVRAWGADHGRRLSDTGLVPERAPRDLAAKTR
jgi:hypothetical protein